METIGRPFEEIVDFITSVPKPEEILAFKPSQETQRRLNNLLTKNELNQLTAEEQKELEQFLLFEHLMRLAKSRVTQKRVA